MDRIEADDLSVYNCECRLCKPVNKNWEEDGFYGYQCFECTSGKTAFIIAKNHKGTLTNEEREIYLKLVEKHYPDLEPKLSEDRPGCQHWYQFLVRK